MSHLSLLLLVTSVKIVMAVSKNHLIILENSLLLITKIPKTVVEKSYLESK